ncbi:BatA domain-containing protein [Daejeonella sp.]|uniref:BatA domain-containing protein n=1 Tax=Daejeonella sp. TaxID=2805397 RepID=UPI002731D500|nr:BatA domain-containing protein [Daejeonella sp.]MDP2413261.1 BatA domain-containing protein [Daejeonella sp.]
MFQLLNPIWLFGISGIIIPLLIHLWNVKKGKTLKIGSVSLLGESSRQNARSLRLLDLLLLLLRCLLIIIVSMLLAEPVWISSNSPAQKGGWILIEKDNFTETYSNFQKEIDSLDQAGYDLHLFEVGFKTEDLNKLKDSEIIRDSTAAQLSYWSLLQMLDQEIPSGKEAYIFTANRLNRFKGERPEIVTKLDWKTYTPKDSSAKWIENVWFTNDSIRAIIAQTEPKGLRKIPANIDPLNRNTAFTLDIQDGITSLSFKNISASEQKPVRVDTSTIHIAFYTDNFKKDAEYLNAAIRAIQKYTQRKIELSPVKSGLIKGDHNIVFWLSEKMPAESQIKKLKAGSSLFIYQKGKTEEINSLIVLPEHSLQKEEIKLRKRVLITERSKNNYAVWEDGFGQPLLDLEITNKLKLYHFYSRFNPEWNGLVWDEDFAKILVPLIIPKLQNSVSDPYDSRSIAESWIIPARAEIKSGTVKKNTESDLKDVFWISLILLFLCERWLSFRKNLN